MITLKNNSKATYIHGDFKLLPDEVVSVPDEVGKIWLLAEGVVEYKDPAEAKKEQAELKKENEALKKEIEKLKETKKETKKTSKKR